MNFSGNKIRSLSGIENHDLLETIDLEDNEVNYFKINNRAIHLIGLLNIGIKHDFPFINIC